MIVNREPGYGRLAIAVAAVATAVLATTGLAVSAARAVNLRVTGDSRIYTVAGPNGCAPSPRSDRSVGGYSADGTVATSALLDAPHAPTPLRNGGFLIADSANNVVRERTPDGRVVTVAGVPSPTEQTGRGATAVPRAPVSPSDGDGGPALDAHLLDPRSVAVLPDGGFLIAEAGGNRIRRVATDGTITTVAGNGTYGFAGDGGPATDAKLASPVGVAVRPGGGFLVVDAGNKRVRAVDAGGTISTVAGGGERAGIEADQYPALEASFKLIGGLLVLGPDEFVLSDQDAGIVWRVDQAGNLSRIAGSPDGRDQDNVAASDAFLSFPTSLARADDGTLLVSESGRSAVRQISSQSGWLTTLVGDLIFPSSSSSGDGYRAARAHFAGGAGEVAITSDGGLLISDPAAARIRFVAPAGTRRLAVALTPRASNTRLRYAATRRAQTSIRIVRGETTVKRIRAARPAGVSRVALPKRLRRERYRVLLTARTRAGQIATACALWVPGRARTDAENAVP